MTKTELFDHEKEYHRVNQMCVLRRRKLCLDVPENEADIQCIECIDEPCFMGCPNW